MTYRKIFSDDNQKLTFWLYGQFLRENSITKMALCNYPIHHIINSINLTLIIGIVGLIFYRYYLISGESKNEFSEKNRKFKNAEDIYNPEEMSFDDLVNYHRSRFLKNYQKITYLDYATSPVLPGYVLQNFSNNLHENLFGNTHSESQSAELSTDTIDLVRSQILELFDTNISEYTVIFTYSQFHSMKLLTESFPFTSNSSFIYTPNSNKKKKKMMQILLKTQIQIHFLIKKLNVTMNLLTIPLVDEFDGTTLTEEQMKHISMPSNFPGKTAIMVDASLYLQNHHLSLSSTPFHAVALSFERLFGFPNIGCLLIHNSLLQLLAKPYFGGGTLVYALTSASYQKLRLSPQDRFEDGSLPFLSIASIDCDFNVFYNDLKLSRISDHISSLIDYLYGELTELRYSNGSPLVTIYTNQDQKQLQKQSIITFNILDQKADIIPYQKVLDSASNHDIYLSGGCFSTPGSCIK